MKITEAKTIIVGNPWKNWVFVRLETDEGIHGIGEATLNGFARTVATAIEELGPFYLGMDPFQVETIVQRMGRDVYSEGGQIHGCAVAAIEVACWDIIGKALDQPIYNLLGGRYHEKVRAYANGWYRGPRTPQSFADKAREVVRRGYTALKFDPFGAAWRITDPNDEALAIDIVAAVRDAVGPSVDLLIEGHNRFSVATAIRFGRRLEPYRPTLVRGASSPPEDRRDRRGRPAPGRANRLRREFFQPAPVRRAARPKRRSYPAAGSPEPGRPAEHQESLRDGRRPLRRRRPPQRPGPHLHRDLPATGRLHPELLSPRDFDEFNVEWEAQIVDRPVRVVDGFITPPDRPGLGIDLNLEECARHPYHPQNYLPLFRPGWERREGAEPGR